MKNFQNQSLRPPQLLSSFFLTLPKSPSYPSYDTYSSFPTIKNFPVSCTARPNSSLFSQKSYHSLSFPSYQFRIPPAARVLEYLVSGIFLLGPAHIELSDSFQSLQKIPSPRIECRAVCISVYIYATQQNNTANCWGEHWRKMISFCLTTILLCFSFLLFHRFWFHDVNVDYISFTFICFQLFYFSSWSVGSLMVGALSITASLPSSYVPRTTVVYLPNFSVYIFGKPPAIYR